MDLERRDFGSAREPKNLNPAGNVGRFGVVVVGDKQAEGRLRWRRLREVGESFGLHGNLEIVNAFGLGQTTGGDRAIGEEVEGVAVEGVVLVLGSGDDEEALPGRNVGQRGQRGLHTFSETGVEGEEFLEAEGLIVLEVRGKDPDEIRRFSEADEDLDLGGFGDCRGNFTDRQPFDLEFFDLARIFGESRLERRPGIKPLDRGRGDRRLFARLQVALEAEPEEVVGGRASLVTAGPTILPVAASTT
jgi:hypothetical protein